MPRDPDTPPEHAGDRASDVTIRTERHVRRRIWAGMLVVVSAVAAVVAWLHGRQASSPERAADVPRLEDGRITFSDAFRDRVQMTTATARSAPLVPAVSVVGTVTFDPRYVAKVATRLRGVVRVMHVYEGAEVERGQPLADIDSPELGEAQAQVTMLRAQAEQAARQAERETRLYEQRLATALQMEEATAKARSVESMLRAAKQRVEALSSGSVRLKHLGEHSLIAPISGTVIERHITQGELAQGDHVAFVVAQLDHLWVELELYEHDLDAVRVGDAVSIRPLGGGEQAISGRVAHVGPVIDQDTRSAPVRVEVDNRERTLRVGQAVQAEIMASRRTQREATVVPAAAVTYVDGEPTIFVLSGPRTVVPTSVTLGGENDEEMQILKGVEPGQEVVVRGVFELKSELFR